MDRIFELVKEIKLRYYLANSYYIWTCQGNKDYVITLQMDKIFELVMEK